MIENLVSGYHVIFYKGENIFVEKQHLALKEKGELFFTKPTGVERYYFKLFNPKNEVLATSEPFIIGPSVLFESPVVNKEMGLVSVNWKIDGVNSSYDWVGLFASGDLKSHLLYNYIDLKANCLSFKLPTSGNSFTFQYFSGENKYLPISNISFQI